MSNSVKWRVGFKGVRRVLFTPEYALLAFVFAAIILLILQWFFNLELLRFIFNTPALSSKERVDFILSGYKNLFIGVGDIRPFMMIVVSIIQGAATSVLLYSIKNTEEIFGGGNHIRSVALTLFGSGCAACGGSILAPLLGGFSAAVAISVSTIIGEIAFLVAAFFAIKSLRDSGVEAARTIALKRHGNN